MGRRLFYCLGLLSLLCLLSQDARAQADQIIYSDSLGAGWQDWSWSARDFNSTDYVHGGSKSIKVTYTGAWQGFYLRHSNFDNSGYTDLVFWVNGGATSNRNVTVAAHINDVSQSSVPLNTYIAGGAVGANIWRKVTIPLSALHVANNANFNGFWLQDASGAAQPAFYVDDISLTAVAPPSQVLINVDANNVRRVIDSRLFGVAGAVWDSSFNTAATVSLLNANGTRVSRFPGGSLSNSYHWQTNTTDGNTFQWATSFDAFAGVIRTVNAQAFITTNYGSGNAQESADWVRYSNITKQYGFKYWEIGNENYGGWESDTHARPHDPFTYAFAARDYINAMKAVDPTIKVGVVVVTGEDSYANYTDHTVVNPRTGQSHNGWTPVMLATLKTLGVTPDFVIYHKYDQGPGAEDDAGLLQSAKSWTNDAANLRQQLNDYLGAQAANVELVCTENNSVSSGPGKQTTSLVNGLFYADSFGQIIQTEFNTLMWWILRNGQDAGNNNSPSLYGWRLYGDYGMVSGQSSPYPTYYMSKLVSRFAAGGDQVVATTSNYNLMAAYGAKRSDGSVSLLLINKSATTSLNASINLAGFQPQSNATVHTYGIPQDEAARTGAGSPDIATSAFAGAGTSFVYTVAPYSATVISLASAACPAGISPANQFFTLNGGDGQIAVAAPAGCNWTAASSDSWIVITSSESGSGNGVVNYTARENFTGNPRQGSITVGGQTLAVIQDSKTSADCQYAIDNSRKSYASNGGSGMLTISTEASCAWTAASSANWLTFTSTNIGIGNGTVAYSVAPNAGPSGRKTTITIAGKTFTIKQK
ncbi:MAG: BACON domain-containing carbohydrate-binding protein [Blastocatellia bacterium]